MLDPWFTRIVAFSGGAPESLRRSEQRLGTTGSRHSGETRLSNRGRGVCAANEPNRGKLTISRWFMVLLAFHGFAASGATLVHDFYLPMPEAQIRQAYGVMETNLSNTM